MRTVQPSADLWQTLCSDLQEQRRLARREEYARVARDFVAASRHILREGSARLGDACEIAGDICSEAEIPSEAIQYYQEAFALARQSRMTDSAGRIAGKLAAILDEAGETHQAAEWYQKALRNFDAAGDHSQHMALLNSLASVRRRSGDYVGAREAYMAAIDMVKALHGGNHPDVALLFNNLGVALTEGGDFTAAEDAHLQALAIREHFFGATHPEVAHSLVNLGVVNHLRGDAAKARGFYEAGRDIYRKFSPPGSPEIAQIAENLRRLSESGRL